MKWPWPARAEELAAGGGGIAVGGLQDGQGVAAVAVEDAGDPGGVVGGVGLEGPAAQGLGEDLAGEQAVADGVGLVAVGDDGGVAHGADGVVNDQGGIGHLALVEGAGLDTVGGGLKDPVAAVDAAAHDEIDDDGLFIVSAAAQQNAPSGVGMGGQQGVEIKIVHREFSFSVEVERGQMVVCRIPYDIGL